LVYWLRPEQSRKIRVFKPSRGGGCVENLGIFTRIGRWGGFLRLCETFVKTCEKIFKESYHYKKRCEVIAMPFRAWIFPGAIQKSVDILEERVITLEVEVTVLKRKLKEHGIE
jgi:hypothetical protein